MCMSVCVYVFSSQLRNHFLKSEDSIHSFIHIQCVVPLLGSKVAMGSHEVCSLSERPLSICSEVGAKP